MGRSGSGFPHNGNYPRQEADSQCEGARIEQLFRPHEVVELEGHAQQKADEAEQNQGQSRLRWTHASNIRHKRTTDVLDSTRMELGCRDGNHVLVC